MHITVYSSVVLEMLYTYVQACSTARRRQRRACRCGKPRAGKDDGLVYQDLLSPQACCTFLCRLAVQPAGAGGGHTEAGHPVGKNSRLVLTITRARSLECCGSPVQACSTACRRW